MLYAMWQSIGPVSDIVHGDMRVVRSGAGAAAEPWEVWRPSGMHSNTKL